MSKLFPHIAFRCVASANFRHDGRPLPAKESMQVFEVPHETTKTFVAQLDQRVIGFIRNDDIDHPITGIARNNRPASGSSIAHIGFKGHRSTVITTRQTAKNLGLPTCHKARDEKSGIISGNKSGSGRATPRGNQPRHRFGS